ncbi:MAG: hypothetical protein QM504_16760 [Pseudomonadota bacterium]
MKISISLLTVLSSLLLVSCITVTVQQPNHRYTGNFRYYAGIAEFFDCKTQKKHYLGQGELTDDLIKAYKKLNLRSKDDVYIRVEGYYQEEEQMEGVDPIDVFVPTKIIQLDTTRSCKRPYRRGL